MNTYQSFEKSIQRNKATYCKDLDKPEELKSFLKRLHLFFEISEELFYLIQVHILTSFSIIDETGISRGINYNKFCTNSNASKTFSKKLLHYYQKNLSIMSCDFIKKISQDLLEYNQRHKVLTHLQSVDADMRNVLPCYEATKIIIEHALRKNVPVLIVYEKSHISTKEKSFLFLPNQSKTDFELCNDIYPELIQQPCIVIKGTSRHTTLFSSLNKDSFIHNINMIGLKTIILANMAKHRQYPSKKNTIIDDNPYEQLISKISTKNITNDIPVAFLTIINQEFLTMRKLAENLGCFLENSNLFLIRHIYCDFISNYFQTSNFGAICA